MFIMIWCVGAQFRPLQSPLSSKLATYASLLNYVCLDFEGEVGWNEEYFPPRVSLV